MTPNTTLKEIIHDLVESTDDNDILTKIYTFCDTWLSDQPEQQPTDGDINRQTARELISLANDKQARIILHFLRAYMGDVQVYEQPHPPLATEIIQELKKKPGISTFELESVVVSLLDSSEKCWNVISGILEAKENEAMKDEDGWDDETCRKFTAYAYSHIYIPTQIAQDYILDIKKIAFELYQKMEG